ncbi:MAG: pentapeptide repeat-containing protein [Promethearchaeota archaeon]
MKFPLSDQPGSDYSDVDKQYMRAAAEQSDSISLTEWKKILSDHLEFLNQGGGGGDWQTMNLNGVILGLYSGPKNPNENKNRSDTHETNSGHALLNNKKLSYLPFKGVQLSYANLVGVICETNDLTGVHFNHALATDAYFKDSIFDNGSFIGTDFSRSDFRGCSFQNANLKYTDFENCDLTGADFRGAILKGSRFPGAILKNTII